jgi:membrane-associated phospholipid phosphatase
LSNDFCAQESALQTMKHYRFVDYATQGYIALTGLLILCFHNKFVPQWPWLLAAHIGMLGLVHSLILASAKHAQSRGLDFLRHFYPVLLYTAFYREVGVLDALFFPGFLDEHVILFEERLFGMQPSLLFMDRLPCLAISELFYAAYLSYYVMIAGIGVALFLRCRRQFFHYVSVVSAVFYSCYLAFIFLPVTGPRLFFQPLEGFHLPAGLLEFGSRYPMPEHIKSGVFYQIVTAIFRAIEPTGAALPSSHVAVALCTVFFSFRYLRKIRYIHLAAAILLCLSTVYCRFHYAVDMLAGIGTAALLVPVANALYQRVDRRFSR